MGKFRRNFVFIKTTIEPSQQALPAVPPPKIPKWRRPLYWAKNSVLFWVVSSIAGVLWGLWVASPPWTLTLPSASYRPRNPFTAVFAITNADIFPGYDVRIECVQNLIKYVTPRVFSKSTSEVPPLGMMSRTDSRTFSCPQVVLNVQTTWNRVLAPEEIKQMYLAGPPKEDMSFEWADFEFHVTYSLMFINRTNKYRVVGRPGENGMFIWEQVALDKKF
jgi:hypothetical protein